VPEGNTSPLEIVLSNIPPKPENLFMVFRNSNSGDKPLFGISNLEFKK
jgi:hypothetical protein